MLQVEPASQRVGHLSAELHPIVQLLAEPQLVVQVPAPEQLTLQVELAAQDGVHEVAPVQSKLQVLWVPQLASQLCAPPHATSHVHIWGQASTQSVDAGQLAAEQTPAWQSSPVVHDWPSSQTRPSRACTAVHAPVLSSQIPVLHWSLCPEQSLAVPPVHWPLMHCSPVVHKSPSSQLGLFGTGMRSQRSAVTLQ